MRGVRGVCLTGVAALLLAGGSGAQEPTEVEGAQDDPLTVYLFTAGPGGAVWERFGHNGLWIHDARTGRDILWEWGVFDFDQVGFWGRLARGTMLYSMRAVYMQDLLAVYERQGRDVWAQELALTPAQERELYQRVVANDTDGNRDYTYDYYLDNCSTRVRDHLDAVLNNGISDQLRGSMTGRTWRDHTLRLLRPSPGSWAGVQFVLGRPGDAEIDRWDELFLPMQLRSHLRDVTVPTPEGELRPLVVRELQLADGSAFEVTESRPTWWPIALGISLLLGGGIFGLLRGAAPNAGRARAAGLVLVGWGAVLGLAGTVLALAWFFTDHDFWRWNENLLVASPLTLGWIVIGARLLRARGVGGERGMRIVTLLGVLAGLALLLQLIPGGQATLAPALVGASIPLGAWLGLRTLREA